MCTAYQNFSLVGTCTTLDFWQSAVSCHGADGGGSLNIRAAERRDKVLEMSEHALFSAAQLCSVPVLRPLPPPAACPLQLLAVLSCSTSSVVHRVDLHTRFTELSMIVASCPPRPWLHKSPSRHLRGAPALEFGRLLPRSRCAPGVIGGPQREPKCSRFRLHFSLYQQLLLCDRCLLGKICSKMPSSSLVSFWPCSSLPC